MGKIATFAREMLGVELWPVQAAMLDEFEGGKYSGFLLQWGRQSGKSTVTNVLAMYDALVRRHLQPLAGVGKERTIIIVSATDEDARKHIKECADMAARNPAIAKEVVRETNTLLAFKGGAVIRSFPCSARAIRGRTASSVILDEYGHFLSSEDGNATSEFVWSAADPALTNFGEDGWMFVISTPLWKQGKYWELVDECQQGERPDMLYQHKGTLEINPTEGARKKVERVEKTNFDEYNREYLANFIDGAGSYLPEKDVRSAKRGDNILPPRKGFHYVAAIDPAYQHDNFTLCIGHKEGPEILVDGVWAWFRPGYEAANREVAALCRDYGVQSVRTDQHSPEPIRAGLDKLGLPVEYVPHTNESKQEMFNRLKVNLSWRAVSLPNDDEVIKELLGLEARPTRGGFTHIGAAGKGKDDRAIVVASVVQQLDRPNDVAVIFAGDEESIKAGYWGQASRDVEGDEVWPATLSSPVIIA